MSHHVLAALRSQPWAILPEYLPALEAIAARALDLPPVAAVRENGHVERYAANIGAIAEMGERLPGSRSATVRDGVAAIPLFGPIFPRASLFSEISGAATLDTLAAEVRLAAANRAVSRILLVVDSPGGAVSGTAEFASFLRGVQKPVFAHVSGVGASAAYWIASQAQEISVDTTGMVGSIGVVTTASHQVQPDTGGYLHSEITSSNAPAKRVNPTTDDGVAILRAMLDEIEQVFIADVARGRGVSPDDVTSKFGGGSMKAGKYAVKAGMADRVDTLDGVLSRLAVTPTRTSGSRALAQLELDTRRRRSHR